VISRRRRAFAGAVMALACVAMLAGCVRAPDETARQQAISDHVLRAEDYPLAFVRAEKFAYRNLQRVPDADPVQFAVDADFDVTYTAAGDAIVAALREQERAERQKERRRTNTALERLASAVSDALTGASYEQRFAGVRVGDHDHYSGHFVLARNEDGSWRVVTADYR
jgi:hypothetical protein